MDAKQVILLIIAGFISYILFIVTVLFLEEVPEAEQQDVKSQKVHNESNYVNNQGIYDTENRLNNLEEVDIELNRIANTNISNSQKADQAIKLADYYKPTSKDIENFTNYILHEYETGSFISNLDDESYMLGNLFISRSVEYHYDDRERLLIDDFSYDFMQITRDLYRGSAVMGDQFISANMDQLKRNFNEMKEGLVNR